MGGRILYAENSSVSILRDFSTVEFNIYKKNTHTIQRQKIPRQRGIRIFGTEEIELRKLEYQANWISLPFLWY